MAYNNKNFSVMAYANGFTLWNYQTPDALTAVKGSGYFNESAPFIRKGDMILAMAGTSGTLAPAILYIGNVADGVVTVADVYTASE